jgi:hypothetical protein
VENLLAHYGIDWLAMALSLYGAYLLGNKKEIGFIIFAISNVIWILLGLFFMSSYGMAIGNLAFFLINLRGYVSWKKNDVELKNDGVKA